MYVNCCCYLSHRGFKWRSHQYSRKISSPPSHANNYSRKIPPPQPQISGIAPPPPPFLFITMSQKLKDLEEEDRKMGYGGKFPIFTIGGSLY